MTLEQSLLLVVTIALVALVVFLIVLICKLCKTLNLVHKKIEDVGDDLNVKSKCFDPLFRAMNNVGEGLEYKSVSFKDRQYWQRFKEKVDQEEGRDDDKISDIVEMAVSGINLWQKLRK